MNEVETCRAKSVAITGGPAAFGADGESDGRGKVFERTERAGRFVVVEGEARERVGKSGEKVGKRMRVGDAREAGVEGLFGAGDDLAPPFVGGPERAVGVVGVGLFGCDEIDRGDAEGREVAKDVAGGLGARESDDDGDRCRGNGGVCGDKGEGEGVGGDGGEGGFAAGAVDEAGVEGVAGGAFEDFEDVARAAIGARERAGEIFGSEEDEVHGGSAEKLVAIPRSGGERKFGRSRF